MGGGQYALRASAVIVTISLAGAGPVGAVPYDYGAYIYLSWGEIDGNHFHTTDVGGNILTGQASDSYATGQVLVFNEPGVDGNGNPIEIPHYTSLSASADLATGLIKGACSDFGCGNVIANIYDTLYFDLTGLTDPFDVTFDVFVDGTFGPNTMTNFSMSLTTPVSGSFAQAAVQYRTSQPTDDTASPETLLNFTQNGSFDVFGPDEFSGTVTIDPTDYLSGLAAMVVTYNFLGAGYPYDFSNTVGFNLFSPVPYTSASGVFLSNVPTTSEVPVPAALPLPATGVGLLGLTGWRKRRRLAA